MVKGGGRGGEEGRVLGGEQRWTKGQRAGVNPAMGGRGRGRGGA